MLVRDRAARVARSLCHLSDRQVREGELCPQRGKVLVLEQRVGFEPAPCGRRDPPLLDEARDQALEPTELHLVGDRVRRGGCRRLREGRQPRAGLLDNLELPGQLVDCIGADEAILPAGRHRPSFVSRSPPCNSRSFRITARTRRRDRGPDRSPCRAGGAGKSASANLAR